MNASNETKTNSLFLPALRINFGFVLGVAGVHGIDVRFDRVLVIKN